MSARRPVRALLGALIFCMALAICWATSAPQAAAATRGFYVANYNASGTITQFGMQTATGSLSALSPASVAAGNSTRIIALTPNGKFAYATNSASAALSSYVVGSGGALTPTSPSTVSVPTTPVGVIASPDGKHVYAGTCSSNLMYAFDVNQTTGVLTPNAVPTISTQCPHKMVFSPDGKHLYATGWNGNAVRIYDVNTTTGSLSAHSPASVSGVTGPVGIAIAPDGTSLYVSNDGASSIAQFTVNTATGNLTAKSPATISSIGPMRSIALSPDGRRLYAATHGADSVSIYNVASGTGLLSAASPASVTAGTTPRSVIMSPDGKRLFVSNTGNSTVSLFDVNTSTGALTAASPSSVAGGSTEWGIAMVPNQGPTASFTQTINGYGTASTFNASASSDPDGTVARYDWDWGDGTTTSNGGATPSHTFATPGTFTVTLTVTDDEGCSTTTIQTGSTAYCRSSGAASATQTAKVRGPGRSVFAVNATAGTITNLGLATATGTLIPMSPASVSSSNGPRHVVTTPNGRWVYVFGTSGALSIFGIDAISGELTPAAMPSFALTGTPINGAVTPDGKHLLVARSGLSSALTLDINAATGALSDPGLAQPSTGANPSDLGLAPNGRFAYVLNGGAASLSAFAVNASTGAMSALGVPTYATGSGPTAVAISPNGHFLFVSHASVDEIRVFAIDESTGSLSPVGTYDAVGSGGHEELAVSIDGRHLYSTNTTANSISQFDINQQTGALTPLTPAQVSLGQSPRGLAVTPDGKRLLIGSFGSAAVLTADISPSTGALTAHAPASVAADTGTWGLAVQPNQGPTASFTQTLGSPGVSTLFDGSASSDPDGSVARYDWDFGDGTTLADGGPTPAHTYAQTGTYTVRLTVTDQEGCSTTSVATAHGVLCNAAAATTTSAITIGLRGRYVYAGNRSGGSVSSYRADRSSGVLTATVPATSSAAGQPRRVALTPDGRFAYVAGDTSNAIHQYRVDPRTGVLTALSIASISTGANTAPVNAAVTPDGKHLLFVQNSGSSNTVRSFDIDSATGLLSDPGFGAVAAGSRPVDLALTSDGRYAYVANNSGSSVSQYSVDASTGRLTPLATSNIAAGTGPSALKLSRDGRFLYVANVGSAFLSTYAIAASDGQLAATATTTVPSGSNDVLLSPDGQHLLSLSTNGTATAFTVNPNTGALTPNGSASSAPTARGGAFSADGNHVYVADSGDNALLIFDRSGGSGLLTAGSPSSVPTSTGPWGVSTTPDQGPVASFTRSIVSSGSASSFDGSASSDPDGTVARYDWDFGDGTSVSNGGPTPTHVFASGGSYTVKLTVTDDEGCSDTYVNTGQNASCNPSSAPTATQSVMVATTPPTITDAPSGTTTTRTSPVAFTGAAGHTFECQVDGAGWTACTSPATFSGLSDGPHTAQVRAVDAADHRSAPVSATWSIDATAPTLTVTSGPQTTVATTSASFAFTSDDAGASLQCKLDAASWSGCTSPASFSALTDGAHTFAVRGTDALGNVGTPATRTWTVDTTPPATTITSAPVSPSRDASPSYAFTADDVAATFECLLDGGAWTPCTSPTTFSARADGSHTFSVRATDAVGNTGAADSHLGTIDTVAPSVAITGRPSATSASGDATFTFTSGDDPSASFECRLDGAAYSTCTSPRSFSGLADSSHTFDVRAIDLAGNVAVAVSASWTIDTAGPATSLVGAPAALTNRSSESIGFVADEPGSTFDCRLDNASWAPCTSPKLVDGLADGSHTLAVRATDPYGNTGAATSVTWTVDTSAPTAGIDAAPPALVSDARATIAFGTQDPGATLTCQLDAGSWAPCTSPASLTDLSDGPHTFRVRATDLAGNTGPASAASWTIDTTAPGVSITSAPASLTGSGSATFAFASGDAAASFACRVDGEAWTSCTSPNTVSRLTDGAHTFAVRATDPVGNVGTPDTVQWTVDTSAPEATITGRPDTLSTSDEATFTFTSPATQATFECRLDAGSWESCVSPKTLTGLADGGRTFAVRATNQAGTTSSPATSSWTIDTQAPGTTITNSPPAVTNSRNATITFTSGDPTSTFQCRLSGGPWSGCVSPKSFTGLADGDHTVEVRATDLAGNTGAPDSATWTIDTVAPSANLSGGPVSLTTSTSATFALSSDDPAAEFACALDSGAWAPCSDPATSNALADGEHTFRVRATDAAGNTGSVDLRTWTIDTSPPRTTILTGPAGVSNRASASATFAADEAGVVFTCQLDGAAWNVCTSPATVTGLTDGSHQLRVRGTDPAGNVGPSDLLTWLVDTAAPGAVITSAPIGTVATDTGVVAFEANDSAATFECQLDGSAWAACTSPRSLTGLSEGNHTFRVRAIDGAGNASDPAEVTWTVDTVAPTASITRAPGAVVATSSATLEFSSNDASAVLTCRLDGGGWTPCTSPQILTGLADGPHDFQVRATDDVGNVGAADLASWRIDTTPPRASITSGPPALSSSSNATVAFTLDDPSATAQCRVDTGAWEPCTSPLEQAGLSDGTHVVRVRGIDAVGNTGVADSLTWTVDTIAPTASITAAPPALGNAPSATFEFAAADPSATFECQVDAGSWSACATPRHYNDRADGLHTFRVRATDAAGNTGPVASRQWTIDTTPPTTTITGAPPSITAARTATVGYGSTDPSASFECRLDSDAWAPCTSPSALTALAEGSHTLQVRATDAAGNTGPATFATWQVDTTGPTTTITAKPGRITQSRDATFAFVSADVGAQFECRLDAGRWSPCLSPTTVEGLADGTHTFDVRATDAVGNVGDLAAAPWLIDTGAPTAKIDSAPPALLTQRSAAITYSSSDGSATFECRLDGQTWFACTSPTSVSALADGPHRFEVRPTDLVGNVGAVTTATWEVDATAPDVTIDTVVPRKTTLPRQRIAFSSSDRVASFECRLDGGAWDGCTSPQSVVASAEGPHVFDVRARDLYGNVGAADSRSWTLSLPSPRSSIDAAPTGYTSDPSPTFRFSADDPDATFECRFDDERWTSCTSPLSRALDDGIHGFSVRATSVGGTMELDPAVRSFAIDTVAPDTSVANVPTGQTADDALLAEFTSNELAPRFRCSLDGAPVTDCGRELQASRLSTGGHRIVVAAVDRAGNIDPTPADRQWTVQPGIANPLVLSASADSSRRRLRCAQVDVPGASASDYQWLRDGVVIPGAVSETYVPTPRDQRSRLACSLGLRFTSGAVRRVTAEPVVILGRARLGGMSLAATTFGRTAKSATGDATVQFTLNRSSTVLVRLWCRPTTAAACPTESPLRKNFRRALGASVLSSRFQTVDRSLVRGRRGINRVSLAALIPQALPPAEYRVSLRLHERGTPAPPRLSAMLEQRFTIR